MNGRKRCAKTVTVNYSFFVLKYLPRSSLQVLSILTFVDVNRQTTFHHYPRSPLEETDQDSITITLVLPVPCGKGLGLLWENGGITQVTFQPPSADF